MFSTQKKKKMYVFFSFLLTVFLIVSALTLVVADSKTNNNPYLMIRTTMTLQPKPTLACNNQLEQCFETRFSNCFRDDAWFRTQRNSLTISVFRTALPWGYDNTTSAPEVTIIFQLLVSSSKSPDASATNALIAQASALSTDRKVRDKCNFAGLKDGFRLLTAWKEPLPPPSDLSENWLGIGMSILCAFIPVIVISMNVYRRWRKISISNENYKKIMHDLMGKKKKNGDDDDDSDTTATTTDDNDSDFDQLLEGGSSTTNQNKSYCYYQPPNNSVNEHESSSLPQTEESAVEMTDKGQQQQEILRELNEHENRAPPSAEAVVEEENIKKPKVAQEEILPLHRKTNLRKFKI